MVVGDQRLEQFQDILNEKRLRLLKKARSVLGEEMVVPPDELPDEVDKASTESQSAFSARLRGREKTFLKKIDYALSKIEDGSFGICEECEEAISPKRLEARPEATLCIQCKEAQEHREKSQADRNR